MNNERVTWHLWRQSRTGRPASKEMRLRGCSNAEGLIASPHSFIHHSPNICSSVGLVPGGGGGAAPGEEKMLGHRVRLGHPHLFCQDWA